MILDCVLLKVTHAPSTELCLGIFILVLVFGVHLLYNIDTNEF